MASEVGIVNAALHAIAGKRISSLTEGSKNANVALDLYEERRDALLRSHPWNFATRRVKLAQSATVPGSGFDHAYPLPADWLRTISVHDNDEGRGTVEFKVENIDGSPAILANEEEIYLRYVARITDPNAMPPDFRRALASDLAREMAVPIAQSRTLRDTMAQEAKADLRTAKSTDAMGQYPDRRPVGSWVTRRFA